MNWNEQSTGTQRFAPADIRLLFPDGHNESFWKKVRESAAYAPWVREIRAEGERLMQQPIPELTYSLFMQFERDGTRLPYERVYFEKRRRLNTMALLTLLEPEQTVWKDALHDIVWSVCGEYSWCLPAHLRGSLETDGQYALDMSSPEWNRFAQRTHIDLFAAETGFALSEILSLLGDTLSELLRSRITEEIKRRLFKPFLLHGPYHWETATHNWAAVCAGSIGSAALHLLAGEEEGELAAIITKVHACMDSYLSGFGDDGACLEGVGYWNYGFGFFVYYADLLKKRTRGAEDWFQLPKVKQIALFQQKSYLNGNATISFSDSSKHVNVQIGLSHYLAGLYPEVDAPSMAMRAPFTEDHCSRWGHALRNLIWFDPGREGASWPSADYYLPHAQWLVSRQVLAAAEYGFAAKAGHNDEPHNHNDLGQFILMRNGLAYAADLGCGEYTADYFGAGRYSYDCNGSQGHSVPIIDGCYQEPGAGRAAAVRRVDIQPDTDVFEIDLAKAYELPHLEALVRTMTWRKTDVPSLVLEDVYTFTQTPQSIVERFVTQCEPHMEGNRMVLQAGDGGTLQISFDAEAVSPVIIPKTFMDHDGRPAAWYAVDFAVKQPTDRIRLAFQFDFNE
ncbi:heparinase II/III family protein [Paenibacillus aestuarii]|uniref:Heparinase II/III family protein n=1 Tax=Paenibacillus aestuarii TaxID=516965 RepID=A0ABW0K4Q5_9BACL|nr:heparinase II/III family protein [Paenibacillus aestuarii]